MRFMVVFFFDTRRTRRRGLMVASRLSAGGERFLFLRREGTEHTYGFSGADPSKAAQAQQGLLPR